MDCAEDVKKKKKNSKPDIVFMETLEVTVGNNHIALHGIQHRLRDKKDLYLFFFYSSSRKTVSECVSCPSKSMNNPSRQQSGSTGKRLLTQPLPLQSGR